MALGTGTFLEAITFTDTGYKLDNDKQKVKEDS